jgi:NADPH:quinone reductase-like Zn-dependent oxidoreductase
MKAIAYHAYGPPADVLRLEDVDRPPLRPDAVLVRVRAAAVNPYDWHFVRGKPYFMRLMAGLRAPKQHVLGVDFAGVVEDVGRAVTTLERSDEVYGMWHGAFGEYLSAPESEIALKPKRLSFGLAAAVPLAGLTALQGLRDAGQVRSGHKVLIIGASGGVGTFAVQIAKHLGAHVTGVCSTRNVDLVRSLGADAVIDYTRQDFAASGTTYDVIFQLGGMHSPSHCRRALTPKGRLVLSSGDSHGRWIGPMGRVIRAMLLSPFVSQTLVPLQAKRSKADLQTLAELIDAGKLEPVIDRTYPLDQVPEAVGYVEQGHSRGKVLIAIDDTGRADRA